MTKVSYVSSVYADGLNVMSQFKSPVDWPMLRNALAPAYYSVKDCDHFIDELAKDYATQFINEYERRNNEYENR